MKASVRCYLVIAIVLVISRAASAATPLTTTRVASGLARPLFVTAPPGDTSRVFIAEQRGSGGTSTRADVRILNIPGNTLNGTPFCTITGVNTGNEEGLLGLAFHPDFFSAPGSVNRGAFFVYYTSGGNNHVVRFTTLGQDPTANYDSASAQTVIDFSHPTNNNHNGGWIGFGPDGYLYIATGDGGSACDPPGNAQNTNSLLGKMHRLDVNADQDPGSSTVWGYVSPAGNPYIGVPNTRSEIWHYGLRNPFRDSFDRLTGELYIGDVGQNFREEISYAPAGASNINYGWDIREGFQCSNGGLSGCASTCDTTGKINPIWDVVWANGFAIIGGYVYRGNLIPDLQGSYFFAEYITATIWSFRYLGVPLTAGDVTNRTAELAPGGGMSITNITSFGEDAAGELYICKRGTGTNGEVYKIIVNCTGSSLSISSDPASQAACQGQSVVFSVGTTGERGATSYDWRKGGVSIGAPSLSTLTLTNVQPGDAGSYDVVVQDQCNSATSNSATLTVNAPGAGDIDADCDADLDDVPLFVDVLLGLDIDPGRVMRANVNLDGQTDGLDIDPFTHLVAP